MELSHYEKYGRKCYEKNKDKYIPVRQRWAKANRGKIIKIVQAYVKRNKKKVADYNSRFGKSLDGKYRLLKYRHKERIFHDQFLTLKEYTHLFSLPCIYCGGDTNGGLDRIDNTSGYSKENSAPCCRMCNYMKKNYTTEDFLAHINKIYEHQH